MTVRVIAIELCSASHLLPVSRKRSQQSIELLHKDPQRPLRVGLQFTRKWNGINHTRQSNGCVTLGLRSCLADFSQALLAAYCSVMATKTESYSWNLKK